MNASEKIRLEGESYDDAFYKAFRGIEDDLFNRLPWQKHSESKQDEAIGIEALYLDISESEFKFAAGAYLIERLDAFWQHFIEESREAAP